MRQLVKRLSLFALSVLAFFVYADPNTVTPTRQLTSDEYPYFSDDLNFENMVLALDRQIERYREKNLSGTIKLGDRVYRQRRVLDSLVNFRRLVSSMIACLTKSATPPQHKFCFDQFNVTLTAEYDVFAPLLVAGDPRESEPKPAFFTAYYTPEMRASRVKTDRFAHAVYMRPDESEFNALDRVSIDFDHRLEGKGYDLFYVEDLFDIYLLQVQGGGRAVFTAKGEAPIYISYAGTNGKAFRFISKYMQQKGYIQDPSIFAQRQYLKQHPNKQREIYSYCPGYVYFKRVNSPPLGNDGVPLTDNRSLATDSGLYQFKGLLSFVMGQRPIVEEGLKGEIRFRDFSRFFLDQDTGGAIRGKARADLYFGEGPYAELAAYSIQNRGDIYFLMLKPGVKGRAP